MFPRPGKQSVYVFENFFVEEIAGFGSTIADEANELPWIAPNNISKDTSGIYASVQINTSVPAVDGLGAPDGNENIGGTLGVGGGGISGPSLTPSTPPEFALMGEVKTDISGFIFTPDAPWETPAYAGQTFSQITGAGAVQASGAISDGPTGWALALNLFKLIGSSAPAIIQSRTITSGTFAPTTYMGNFTNPVQAGNSIMVVLECNRTGGGGPTVGPVGDGVNEYILLSNAGADDGMGHVCQYNSFLAQNIQAGSPTVVILINNGIFNLSGSLYMLEIQGGQQAIPSLSLSEQLQAINFPFNINPTVGVLGFQVEVSGHQTSADPTAKLTLQLLNPTLDSPAFTFQLPSMDGTVTLGTPATNWGLSLTPDLLNNPNFGVKIQAQSLSGVACTFDIYSVKIKAFITPQPAPDFNYLKTFERTAGEVANLALDSNGILWEEDPVNNPGVLTEAESGILPDSFAQSATVDDREFIAFSNLLNGTDLPQTFDGTTFSRLSQVGPGAAPTCTSSTTGSAIETITQNPAVPLLTGPHDWIQISDSPADIGAFGTPATPGNVMRLVFRSATTVPSYITAGSNIVIEGFPALNGFRVDNDPTGVAAPAFYTVTAVGQAIPGQLSYDAITFIVPFTTFYNQPTTPGCTFQSTTATMTTAVQVPNLEVGDQFTPTGTGGGPPAGYDSTWTVLTTPNASQMEITSTALIGNTATYGFVLQTGVNPVPGQAVTVTLTLNGNGIFNVTNGIITSVTAGSFSITLNSPDIPSAPETGAGIVLGTIFTFDAFTIVGDKSGGTVVTTGVIGQGIRKCCYSYLTDNGYITQPSPVTTFNVTLGASTIAVANLSTGPSNVVARIVFFTAGNGSNFYFIAVDVPIINAQGVTVNNTATKVNDNTTTNAIFSFSDGVLLGTAETGGSVDVQGNNIFETPELGSCVGLIPYAGRVFAIGEQNKVDNFLNWSFDGGIGVIQSTAAAGGGPGINQLYPDGWLLDTAFGNGVSVVSSPVFGNALQISNTTGSTQATYGMITQGAFQDQNLVPIIQASTTYSVRLAASVPTGVPAGGNLVVDLFSPKLNRSVGTFTTPLNGMLTAIRLFAGTMLTTVLAPVPNDLLLRVYVTAIPTGTTVLVDRVEVFPTEEPNLSTQIIGSYQLNFEAFDRVTGVVDCSTLNQQPVKGAFVLFDTLYIVKSGSILSIQDVKGAEPSQWGTPRTVSASIGTTSIYGVTSGVDADNQGEEWAIVAGRQGAFLFTGGEPIRITEEIQALWNNINWTYGHTLWVKNDIINRRIMFGVPLKMPAKDAFGHYPAWLPPNMVLSSNPTTPNVVLGMSYKQLTTAGEVADRIEVHSSSYTGKLLAIDISRKWSIWTIQAPCAAFLTQGDATAPLFVGNSQDTGKVYELVSGLLNDDGAAFEQRYCTYGFLSTDQEQQLQVGSVRKNFRLLRALMDGIGPVRFNVYLDKLWSDYSVTLSPDIVFPLTTSGDVEIPVEQEGERCFVELVSEEVDAGFNLSKLSLGVKQSTWAPVRGRNS